MILEKYSMGIGDRFGREGKAQLSALIKARKQGIAIAPVWNKSYREHAIVGTTPSDVRAEADAAVGMLGWKHPYYVDADHISLDNVDMFIESSDFFTLDIADFIGAVADESKVRAFVDTYRKYTGSLAIAGIAEPLIISAEQVEATAWKFLTAIHEAGKIYRHIKAIKGADNFITEVSMDETEEAQSPVEMLFILAGLAEEGIGAQTIAPKFTGRFNKGVDFRGDIGQFTREFERDIAVIGFAVREFSLPGNLKLSVHSGSDKFSLYSPINKALKKFDAGLHLKTAGTTWLEELIGLAMAGGDGLDIAKELYREILGRFDELCDPYRTVIEIDKGQLPSCEDVDRWSGEEYAGVLRHDLSCEQYNPNFRQLLHVGYRIAAEMGPRFLDLLGKYEQEIGENVSENLYQRHIKAVFA